MSGCINMMWLSIGIELLLIHKQCYVKHGLLVYEVVPVQVEKTLPAEPYQAIIQSLMMWRCHHHPTLRGENVPYQLHYPHLRNLIECLRIFQCLPNTIRFRFQMPLSEFLLITPKHFLLFLLYFPIHVCNARMFKRNYKIYQPLPFWGVF